MKNIFLMIFGVAFLAMAQNMEFEVVAMVDDRVITNYDLERAVNSEIRSLPKNLSDEEYQERVREIRDNAIQSIVNYELAYLEFQALKAKIPQEAVQKRINSMVNEQAGGDVDLFNDMLFNDNMTRADFEKRIYKDIAVEAFVYDRVKRNIIISDDDIDAYFAENNDELVDSPEKFRIFSIAIKKDGRYAEIGAKQTAEDVLEKLRNGADFALMAKKYSEGIKAAEGGDLGWQSDLAPILKAIIVDMKPGDLVGAPIFLGSTYYVIKYAGYQPAVKASSLPENREKIRRILAPKAEKEKYASVFKELANKYSVIILK